jgi:hypothetical protein
MVPLSFWFNWRFILQTQIITENFLENTQREMRENGVTLLLEKNQSHILLPDGTYCNGYFEDDPEMVFVVAMGKDIKKWLPVYIHEYCHYRQCIEGAPVWRTPAWEGHDEFWEEWFENGKKYPQEVIDRYINVSMAVEADCERRAVKLLEENDLGISVEEYSQKANSYIHFYNFIRLRRKWYTANKEPYSIEDVWSQFNTTIDDDFSISYEYIDLFEKHCV